MELKETSYFRTRCRACESKELKNFLSLGPTPLANSFLDSKSEFDDEVKYPLDVYFCNGCSLVQILEVVDPEILFRDYLYVTGTSNTIVAHNKEYAANVVDLMELGKGDKVAEVASNNGQLLGCFAALGMKVLGIEPASNIAVMANEAGIDTVNEFFSLEAARKLRRDHGSFRAIVANNVLAHVDTPVDFLSGCREMIDDDGRVVFEVPYLGEFLERLEYDTVYHEHLCYFSVTALAKLCEAAGLAIVRVDHRPVHGGSLRVHAQKSEYSGLHSPSVSEFTEDEIAKGLHDFSTYAKFSKDVALNKKQILDLLIQIKNDGAVIAGYGAAAKGNTFLNYCGINGSLVDFVVDRNPLKIGKFTPGTHLPVLDVSAIDARKPDYLFILAWNFADEIIKQQSEFQKKGGKFIVALPEPRIV